MEKYFTISATGLAWDDGETEKVPTQTLNDKKPNPQYSVVTLPVHYTLANDPPPLAGTS